ncbi:MAG: hypothetical protein OXI81_22425 [Paracoccaceae bacterium]|nr:hypothetical protein [Paracoccaceae bacterium]
MLRVKGQGLALALRDVADWLIAVACAALANQTEFDSDRPRNVGTA